MSKDIGSERYRRILDLVAFLKRSGGKASRRAIEQNVSGYAHDEGETYRQNRMLQNDLMFMRNFMGADIEYDHHSGVYVLKHEGFLLVNIEVRPAEIEALSAGLKIASHFLPHLKNDALKLWQKIANYIPQDLAVKGEELAEATLAALPVEPVKPEVFKGIDGGQEPTSRREYPLHSAGRRRVQRGVHCFGVVCFARHGEAQDTPKAQRKALGVGKAGEVASVAGPRGTRRRKRYPHC